MSVMSHIDQVFEDLKAELVSLVGDLSGVHNAVDNAKVALTPHIVQYGTVTAEETKNDLGNNNENAGEETNTP